MLKIFNCMNYVLDQLFCLSVRRFVCVCVDANNILDCFYVAVYSSVRQGIHIIHNHHYYVCESVHLPLRCAQLSGTVILNYIYYCVYIQ